MMGVKAIKVLNNDFVGTSTGFEVITGMDALRQIIHNRISLGLGEWEAAPESGVDWQGLLNQDKKVPIEKRMRLAIRSAILEDSRVTKITKLDISLNNSTRVLTIDFKCETTEGSIADTVIV